jgi:hypothetical protein
MTLDRRSARLLQTTIDTLSARLGRPWSDFDALPICPKCGAPAARGRIGGVLCLGAGYQPRAPHAQRLDVWVASLTPGRLS